jgi:hypothetical protein
MKPKGKRTLARSRCRREKYKKMGIKEKWILLAQEEPSGKLF